MFSSKNGYKAVEKALLEGIVNNTKSNCSFSVSFTSTAAADKDKLKERLEAVVQEMRDGITQGRSLNEDLGRWMKEIVEIGAKSYIAVTGLGGGEEHRFELKMQSFNKYVLGELLEASEMRYKNTIVIYPTSILTGVVLPALKSRDRYEPIYFTPWMTVEMAGKDLPDIFSRFVFLATAHEMSHEIFTGRLNRSELNNTILDEGLAATTAYEVARQFFNESMTEKAYALSIDRAVLAVSKQLARVYNYTIAANALADVYNYTITANAGGSPNYLIFMHNVYSCGNAYLRLRSFVEGAPLDVAKGFYRNPPSTGFTIYSSLLELLRDNRDRIAEAYKRDIEGASRASSFFSLFRK